MTATETQGKDRALTDAQAATGIMNPTVAELYALAIVNIPEAGSEGWEGILATIATAERPEDLDAAWRSSGGKDLVGRPLEVRSIRRMPSDYGQGLPFFLVVDGADLLTGEKVTLTTGSVGVVGALVIAHSRGWLPIRGTIVESDRPTESGYYPQHWAPYREPAKGKAE